MILGYIHCYTIGPWKDILDEQIQKLKIYGLWNATHTIHIGVLGNETPSITDPKIQIHHGGPHPEKYEGHTLNILQQTCTPQDYVWYTHSKGVRHAENSHTYSCVKSWRRLLEYYVIECYQQCYQALQNNYDAAGSLWQSEPPHYSGNIWWATGKHIAKLPTVIPWAKITQKWHERYLYEFWIGSQPCKALNLGKQYDYLLLYETDIGEKYRPHKIY